MCLGVLGRRRRWRFPQRQQEEKRLLEVEYLLLALDFGEVLFLPAPFGSLQAPLLEVFESGRHGRTLRQTRGGATVLWEPRTKEVLVFLRFGSVASSRLVTFSCSVIKYILDKTTQRPCRSRLQLLQMNKLCLYVHLAGPFYFGH